MIEAIVENLLKGKYLLENIEDQVYANKQLPPYYSSIGGHLRHVLDVFNCLFKGLNQQNEIDLTLRERNVLAENYTEHGIVYINNIIEGLENIKGENLNKKVFVIDDMGGGKCTVESTLGAILMQAQSHAIHHFATIGYLLHHLNITLPIDSFGVNPTTPKENLEPTHR